MRLTFIAKESQGGNSSSPELLAQCIAARDETWKRAVPYSEYAA
jgi:hypothetical protein